MICQHCKENRATFHYKSNINGFVSDSHYCQDCVQMLSATFAFVPKAEQEIKGFLQEPFFGNIFGQAVPQRDMSYARQRGTEAVKTAVFPEIKEGHIPQKASEHLRKRRHLNEQKAKLNAYIVAEDFEQAAILRDEIFKQEQEG